jgi:hypothetical protein
LNTITTHLPHIENAFSPHTPPHRRRNSNPSAPMSGRASVEFLPAWMSYC